MWKKSRGLNTFQMHCTLSNVWRCKGEGNALLLYFEMALSTSYLAAWCSAAAVVHKCNLFCLSL